MKNSILLLLFIFSSWQAYAKEWANSASLLEWSFPAEKISIHDSIHAFKNSPDNKGKYQVALKTPNGEGRRMTLELYQDKNLIHSFIVHPESSFIIHKGLLVYVSYLQLASGCSLTVFDLNSKKKLWKSQLHGIGPVSHSAYGNKVYLSLDKDRIMVKGNESSGKYIEIRNLHTGKLLGYKVFDLSEATIKKRKDWIQFFQVMRKKAIDAPKSKLTDTKRAAQIESNNNMIKLYTIQVNSQASSPKKDQL